MTHLILGIDPGKSGGFAVMPIFPSCTNFVEPFYAEPVKNQTPADIVHAFERLKEYPLVCFLEKVHSMPKQGVRSTFTFGENFGMYIGILTALKIPYQTVSPGTWQRSLGCLSKGDKNVTKRKAQELFPMLTITHATADALLIAEYGRRVHRNWADPAEDI